MFFDLLNFWDNSKVGIFKKINFEECFKKIISKIIKDSEFKINDFYKDIILYIFFNKKYIQLLELLQIENESIKYEISFIFKNKLVQDQDNLVQFFFDSFSYLDSSDVEKLNKNIQYFLTIMNEEIIVKYIKKIEQNTRLVYNHYLVLINIFYLYSNNKDKEYIKTNILNIIKKRIESDEKLLDSNKHIDSYSFYFLLCQFINMQPEKKIIIELIIEKISQKNMLNEYEYSLLRHIVQYFRDDQSTITNSIKSILKKDKELIQEDKNIGKVFYNFLIDYCFIYGRTISEKKIIIELIIEKISQKNMLNEYEYLLLGFIVKYFRYDQSTITNSIKSILEKNKELIQEDKNIGEGFYDFFKNYFIYETIELSEKEKIIEEIIEKISQKNILKYEFLLLKGIKKYLGNDQDIIINSISRILKKNKELISKEECIGECLYNFLMEYFKNEGIELSERKKIMQEIIKTICQKNILEYYERLLLQEISKYYEEDQNIIIILDIIKNEMGINKKIFQEDKNTNLWFSNYLLNCINNKKIIDDKKEFILEKVIDIIKYNELKVSITLFESQIKFYKNNKKKEQQYFNLAQFSVIPCLGVGVFGETITDEDIPSGLKELIVYGENKLSGLTSFVSKKIHSLTHNDNFSQLKSFYPFVKSDQLVKYIKASVVGEKISRVVLGLKDHKILTISVAAALVSLRYYMQHKNTIENNNNNLQKLIEIENKSQ